MKKIYIPFVCGLVLLLSACGAEKESVKENHDSENQSQLTDEEYVPIEVKSEDIEIIKDVTYAFAETSADSYWVTYYAEIKNNADVPVDLSQAEVVYEEEDGSVLGVTNSGIDIIPSVLEPGQVAYVSTYEPIDPNEWPEGIYEATINVDPVGADRKVVEHSVENTKVKYNGRPDFAMIEATGKIVSTKDVNSTGYELAVVMYDKDKNFLGILTGGSDEDHIKKGKEEAFEVSEPPFPPDLMPEVTDWKGVAYTID